MSVVNIVSSDPHVPPYTPTGLTPFSHNVEFTSAEVDAADQYLLYQFPENAWLLNAVGSIVFEWDDLEGATPALEAQVGIGGVDGVLDFVLIATGGSEFQAVGTVSSLQIVAVGPWLDIGGLYVIFDVDTAAGANPQAGGFNFGGVYSSGLKLSDRGSS